VNSTGENSGLVFERNSLPVEGAQNASTYTSLPPANNANKIFIPFPKIDEKKRHLFVQVISAKR
jgi:hypothetical protein